MNEEGKVEDIEYDYLYQSINHLEDELYDSFLTKDKYQNSEILEDFYASSNDIYQTEPKKSYNLRYRVK